MQEYLRQGSSTFPWCKCCSQRDCRLYPDMNVKLNVPTISAFTTFLATQSLLPLLWLPGSRAAWILGAEVAGLADCRGQAAVLLAGHIGQEICHGKEAAQSGGHCQAKALCSHHPGNSLAKCLRVAAQSQCRV